MKQHQVTIFAQPRPELLERVLRVVRHRGFQLSAIIWRRSPIAKSCG